MFVAPGPTFNDDEDLEGLSKDFSCQLPAVYLPEHKYWITGLCSVIRYVIINFGDDKARFVYQFIIQWHTFFCKERIW